MSSPSIFTANSSGRPCQKHPLDPLTPDEITACSLSIRQHIAEHTDIKAVKFITLYLLPPPKRAVLAHLGIPTSPGAKLEAPTLLVRKAEADFLDVVGGNSYNVVLSFIDEKWKIDTLEKLPESNHPQISVEELIECEEVVKNDRLVQKLAAECGVLPHQIACDGWAIGFDDRFPQRRRVQQAFCFARFQEHDNLYAHPLDFVAILDVNTREVLHIDFPPRYHSTPMGTVLSAPSTRLPSLATEEESLRQSQRERIPVPRATYEFLPDLLERTESDFKLREDLKPLHVVQPEGVSFKVNGHEVEWQNWKMHVSFSQREGLALSTITYNDHGQIRPIFYRLSLTEMIVPYGAPEYPHPRKLAFDSGEYGMGTMANELSLGCDCLGQVHYLPGAYVGHSGKATIIKNVICIHEEDDGILWKHIDYRPGGRSRTVRRRRLVVSTVCTVANYEYIWNYYFYQDGTIEFEIRLSGILQVYVAADGEPSPYGTHLAPNINAHNHQHIFCIRVDPMIDGLQNSVIESDVIPVDAPAGSDSNFAGNGFFVKDTVLKEETGRPYDVQKERRWKIANPMRKHYASGKDAGYVVGMKGGVTPLMAQSGGWIAKRATFATNAMWVVKDVEGEKGGRMWPAGKYVPQTREEPADSVGAWVRGKKKIEKEDVVLFFTIGTTHIPRPEDWPVMPVEHLNITFKPNSFFRLNPSLDVPGTFDMKSVPAFQSGSIEDTMDAERKEARVCHA